MKPEYTDFQKILETTFGQPLTPRAKLAATDFWNHWDALSDHLQSGTVWITVDSLILGLKLPEYRKHHPILGLAKLLFIAGLLLLFYSWLLGLGVTVLGVIANHYGNTVRKRTISALVDDMLSSLTREDVTRGMGAICSHFLAGTIQLNSSLGISRWPLQPSNVLTGRSEVIP